MEITSDNFNEYYSKIRSSIQNAEFISFDFEMSGIHFSQSDIQSSQNLNERYQMIREAAMSFVPIQLGLCAFRSDLDTGDLVATPFTFYLYPQKENKSFMVSTEALTFLVNSGMDLNKWVESGIKYSGPLKPLNLSKPPKDIEFDENKDHNEEMANDIIDKITTWYNHPKRPISLKLEAKTNYKIKLILYHAKSIITTTFSYVKHNNAVELYLCDHTHSPPVIHMHRIMKLFINNWKLLVGHNCHIDLMFLLHHFYEPLPPTLDEWKQIVHEKFNLIVDTKHLSTAHPDLKEIVQKRTDLMSLFKKAEESPFSDIGPKIEICPTIASLVQNSFHNAGYDAFCTGQVFVRFWYHIFDQYLKENPDYSFPFPYPVGFQFEELMAPYINQLYQTKCLHKSLNLVGPDPKLELRNNYFLVQNIPLSVNLSRLRMIFAILPSHKYSYIDDNSYWLIVDIDNLETSFNPNIIPQGTLGQIWDKECLPIPRYETEDDEDCVIHEWILHSRQIQITSWENWFNDEPSTLRIK